MGVMMGAFAPVRVMVIVGGSVVAAREAAIMIVADGGLIVAISMVVMPAVHTVVAMTLVAMTLGVIVFVVMVVVRGGSVMAMRMVVALVVRMVMAVALVVMPVIMALIIAVHAIMPTATRPAMPVPRVPVVPVQVDHIVIVIVPLQEPHVEVAGGNPGHLGPAHRDLELAGHRQARQRCAQSRLARSQVEQGRDDHVAARPV